MNELMQRRGALIAGSDKNPLPSIYQQVEYLKNPSGGGAFFTTNAAFHNPFRIYLVCQKDSASTNYARCAIGARSNANNFNQINLSKSGDYGFSGVYADIGNSVGLKTTITAEYNAGTKTVRIENANGIFSGSSQNSDNISTNSRISVFHTGASLVATQFNNGRIYELIVDNPNTNKKTIHLIPCYRKADHKPGMYDTVQKSFYISQGTGEFIVGADVT